MAKKASQQAQEVSGSKTHCIAEGDLQPPSLPRPSPECWGSSPGLHTRKAMCSLSVVAASCTLTFLSCFKRVRALCLANRHVFLGLSAPLAHIFFFYCGSE